MTLLDHAAAPLAPAAAAPARRKGAWADLAVRAASAAVLLPIGVACAWFGGAAWLGILALGFCAGLYEWIRMCRARNGAGVLMAAGIGVLALALASLLWLRADPIMGRSNVMFLLVAVWAGDIGAYVAGRTIGGPRLAPRVSPGKTWSGAIGGLAASATAGLFANANWLWPHGAWNAAMTLGLLIGAAAQLGDLLESLMKRHCGVKDSGRLIPGHGGMLDRLDGLMLAAPVMAFLALYVGRGIVLWN